jgi:hypothetical protein
MKRYIFSLLVLVFLFTFVSTCSALPPPTSGNIDNAGGLSYTNLDVYSGGATATIRNSTAKNAIFSGKVQVIGAFNKKVMKEAGVFSGNIPAGEARTLTASYTYPNFELDTVHEMYSIRWVDVRVIFE